MTKTTSARGFILTFVGLAAFAFAAMVAINVAIDPFWRFDLISIPGLGTQKPEMSSHARLAKAGIVCRLQPRTVILGTSRVEVGIDPQSRAFKKLDEPVYNMGLAGAGLREIQMNLHHAIHASPKLKHVFIGLDFLMFNAHREASVFGTEVLEFDLNRLLSSSSDYCLRPFIYDIDSFLGPKGLVFSLSTLLKQMTEPTNTDAVAISNWLSLYDRNGFRNNFTVIDKTLAPARGYRGMFGDNQERYYASKVWRPPPAQRYCFQADGQSNTLTVFRTMLDAGRAAGVELHLFINPVHARLLLAVRAAGLWPQYEDWKRGLVQAIDTEAKTKGKPPFQLWDFSGFNSVTIEKVPDNGDNTTVMKGFWEPSHYKSELGDLLLSRMIGLSEPNKLALEDFGQNLTSENISDWIMKTRSAMKNYMKAEPLDAVLVDTVVNTVMAESEGANCGYDVEALRAASSLRASGKTAAASDALKRAHEIHNADHDLYASIDVPFRESGFEKLVAQFESGTDLTPPLGDWIAYQNRAIDRSMKGNLTGAIEDFSEAIRIGPVNTALLFLRGTTRLKAGDRVGAATDFEAALKLEPENVTLKGLLDQAIAPEPASAIAGRRLPAAPVNAAMAAALQRDADAKRKAGDLPAAIGGYSGAIDVSPPNTALYYLRGTTRLQTGDRTGAAADFSEALRLEPANRTLKALLEQARTEPADTVPARATDPK